MKVITLRQLMRYLNDNVGGNHDFYYNHGAVEVYGDCGLAGTFNMDCVRDAFGVEPFIPLRGVEMLLYGYIVNASTLDGYTYVLD